MAESKAKKADEGEARGTFEPREDLMFELMKEMFAFGYTAAERMEERAAEFARMRKERMEEFRRDREDMGAKMKDRFDERAGEITGKVKREVQNVMRETGMATQQELDELKGMIAALTDKVDRMSGEAKKAK